MPDSTKPHITPADQRAYALLAALRPDTRLPSIGGKRIEFAGMRGYLITLRVNRRLVDLRAGDPRIVEIAAAFEKEQSR